MQMTSTPGSFDVAAELYLWDDEHWGADLDVLKDALERVIWTDGLPTKYLDVGCGPGFHLSWLARMMRPRGGLDATGLDQSTRMLAQAREFSQRLWLKLDFVEAEFSTYETCERWTVLSCLNNGLGNMAQDGHDPADVRERAVAKMRSLLHERGYFVLSVYNRERFSDEYGQHLRVLPESDRERGDIHLTYSGGQREARYFSHWFTEAEVRELLARHGFEIVFFERRMARFVIEAKAV